MLGTIQINVTESCNLACKYCYMHNRNNQLPQEVINRIDYVVERISQILNVDKFHVSFFGGEPLLKFDLVLELYDRLKDHRLVNGFVIITNGLLLDDEKVDFIKRSGVGVSFSFDGLWTPIQRPQKNSTNDNLLEIYESKKDIITQVTRGCKCMVYPETCGTLVENFEYLVESWGFRSVDFSIVRDDIWTNDSIEHFRESALKYADKLAEYFNKGVYISSGFIWLWIMDNYMLFKYKSKRNWSCFAGFTGCAIHVDGRCYPCSRFATNKLFPLYDIYKDQVFEDNVNFFKDPKVSGVRFPECQSCKLSKKACYAGCKFEQLKQTDFKYSKPVKCVCKLYEVFDEASKRFLRQLNSQTEYFKFIESSLKRR